MEVLYYIGSWLGFTKTDEQPSSQKSTHVHQIAMQSLEELQTTSTTLTHFKKKWLQLLFWNPQVKKCSKTGLKTLNLDELAGYELDLSGSVFLNHGKLIEILKSTKNLSSLNLKCSDISDEELAEAVSILKLTSPHLESLNLGGVYYSKETLKLILDNYPSLKKINLDYLQRGLIDENQVIELVIPWIKNNIHLESFESGYNAYSNEANLKLIDAFPSNLKRVSLEFFDPVATKQTFIDAMQKLSAKCGHSLKELTVNGKNEVGEKTDGLIDNETFALLPQLFPKLEVLHIDCAAVTSSSILRATYLQWPQLKNLDISVACFTSGDIEVVLRNLPQLQSLDLGFQDNHELVVKLAPVLNNLRDLSINYPFAEKELDAGLKALETVIPQLHSFNFGCKNLNDDDLNYIVEHLNHKITCFTLDDSIKVSNQALINALLVLAQKCPQLKELTLAGNILSNYPSEEVSGVTTVPRAFTSLEYLSLAKLSMPIDPSVIIAFIKHNPLLEVIDVGNKLNRSDIEELKKIETAIDQTVIIKCDS